MAEFEAQLTTVKQRIALPPQPVSALVYTPAAHSANLWTPESAQGKLLTQLGFTLATLPRGLQTSKSRGKRHDIIQLGGENLAAGLNGESLFPVCRRQQRCRGPLRQSAAGAPASGAK